MTEDAVYAIADTHFGLRESVGRDQSDEPAYVGDFIRWLEALPDKGKIPVLEGNAIYERQLRPASHLILLGDILELWDAENQNILLSSIPLATGLDRVKAPKFYVLGNHDYTLESTTGSYPVGVSGLEIVEEVYPKPEEDTGIVRPLQIGNRSYIFVHGHQFDRHLARAGKSWQVLGTLRHFGAALGSYSWLIFAMWLMTVVVQWFFGSPLWGWALVLTLALLWIPRFYMTVARPIGNWVVGRKYDREGALKGFRSWWSRFHKRVAEGDNLGIVYGHTHIIDWLQVKPRKADQPGISKAERNLTESLRELGRGGFTLYNISSWVSTKKRHRKVINATIFYTDEDGPLLLGWNWKSESPGPFHIPFEFVRKRSLNKILTRAEVEKAKLLGWPTELLVKWHSKGERI